MPESQERWFMHQPMTPSAGSRPASRTSKRPQTFAAATPSNASKWAAVAAASACRSQIVSPRARAMPARSCAARPRGAAMQSTPNRRHTLAGSSRLPPSTTMTSSPSQAVSPSSNRASGAASFSTGTTALTNTSAGRLFAGRMAMVNSWQPRQESNLHLPLRRRSFYPLNYGAKGRMILAAGSLTHPRHAERRHAPPPTALGGGRRRRLGIARF